jgi:hypothetical protein
MAGDKNFFESLNKKSAMTTGVVGGVLAVCALGFVIMLSMYIKGNLVYNDAPKKTEQNEQINTNETIKSDKPKAELFVMSYCPFGLQMEKAFLPAWELLKDKADFSIKFVSYAMHGLKEMEENTRQYCVSEKGQDKMIAYLKCFAGKDDYKSCLSAAGLTESAIAGCVNDTNNKFKTIVKYNDKATWLNGNYPVYPVHEDLNQQYGVQGSPTLVINGVEVQNVARTAESVKQAVCASFNTQPEECKTVLSNDAYSAGFGYAANTGGSADAACGE